MRKIAIIGNAGGGKSVLARKLGIILDIPVYEFDHLQWRPGWVHAPAGEISAVHKTWLNQPGWVIDGWGSWEVIEERFQAADTLIFVDFPLLVHYWWATKRQVKAALHLNAGWPPDGCRAVPVTGRLFKLMWRIHRDKRPQLVELLRRFYGDKHVIHLRSPKDMNLLFKEIRVEG